MNWAFPLPWRSLGVPVKVHVLFVVVAIGIVLWVGSSNQFAPGLVFPTLGVLAMLFASVMFHEIGHVFAARQVEGDPREILLWPLGGLAPCELPDSPRAHLRVALAGPLMNLLMAAFAAIPLVATGFVPPLNPLSSPLTPRLHNWKDGFRYTTKFTHPGEADEYTYEDPTANLQRKPAWVIYEKKKDGVYDVRDSAPLAVNKGDGKSKQPALKELPSVKLMPSLLAPWQVVVSQFFSVNWLLFALNLLPAFPLDGGRIARALLWRRGDMRSATVTAVFVGFVTMLVIGIYAIAVNDVLPFMLAMFVYLLCRQELVELEQSDDNAAFGYDFSQGYSSLDREPPPPPPPPKPGFFQRMRQWWTERQSKRAQERRENEERRLDELLDKIHREGKQSLTDEEVRFLQRVSRRSTKR
jgi:Zn-dependent protease